MAGAKWKARRTVKSASGTMWVAREAEGGGQHDPDDRYQDRPMATGRIGDLRPKRCAEHRHEGEEAHEDADLEPAEAATGAVDRQVRHDGRQGSVVEEVEGARGAHALGAYGAAGVVTPAPAARRLPQRQLPLSARAGRRRGRSPGDGYKTRPTPTPKPSYASCPTLRTTPPAPAPASTSSATPPPMWRTWTAAIRNGPAAPMRALVISCDHDQHANVAALTIPAATVDSQTL